MPKKSKTKNMVGEVNTIFVKLDKPRTIRKIILSSAIDTARMIKTHVEIKSLREEELEIMNEIKSVCSGVKNMVSSLQKNKLPDLPIEEHEEMVIAVEKPKKVDVKEVHTDSEVVKLKAELEDIERKLKSL